MKPDAAFAATQNSEASLVHWAGTTRKIEKVQSVVDVIKLFLEDIWKF